MDFRDLLRAMRRHWWLVVAALVVSTGTAGLVTALAVPQYATSLTFFVTTPSTGVTDAYQGGLFSQQRVKSYADMLNGDRLARAVADSEGVDLSAQQVQSRVSGRAVRDTVLLEATVTDSDRDRSKQVATALGTEFVSLVEKLETPPGQRESAVKVEVVAGPTLNSQPISPTPVRNLALGGLLGLLLGVGVAALRERLDATVKSAEALQEVAAPTLAVVPFDPTAKHSPLVMSDNALEEAPSHSARAEAFRHLRTNLQFVDVDHQAKVIVITSSIPDEGKSTTTLNLAIAFAEAGRRVALIDGDLRRPKVAQYLGMEDAVGLSNVLAGQVNVDEVLQRWGRRELYVLASGSTPPNPSELLGSRNMAALLERMRETYDVVLVDTPPLLPVTDAAVLAAAADGAVLVVRSGKTHQARIKLAAARLQQVGSRLLGGVLNMQAVKGENSYYTHYGYSYRAASPSPAAADSVTDSGPAPTNNKAAKVK